MSEESYEWQLLVRQTMIIAYLFPAKSTPQTFTVKGVKLMPFPVPCGYASIPGFSERTLNLNSLHFKISHEEQVILKAVGILKAWKSRPSLVFLLKMTFD